jgi:limonene-1,2-epoxide hydrolase
MDEIAVVTEIIERRLVEFGDLFRAQGPCREVALWKNADGKEAIEMPFQFEAGEPAALKERLDTIIDEDVWMRVCTAGARQEGRDRKA